MKAPRFWSGLVALLWLCAEVSAAAGMGIRRGWCVGHGGTTKSTGFHALEPVEAELEPSWCMGACCGTVRWGTDPLSFSYVLQTTFPNWKRPKNAAEKCNLCTGCVKDVKKAEEEANQIYGTVAAQTDPTSSATARAFSSPAGVAVDARNGAAVVHVNNSAAETFVRLPLPAVHAMAGTLAAAARRPGGKGAGTAAVPATHFNAAAHALANAVTFNPPAFDKPSVIFSGPSVSPPELLVHWAVAQSKGPAIGTCSNSVALTDLSRNVFWFGVASAVKSLYGSCFSPDSLRGWHERLASAGGGRVPVSPPPLPPQQNREPPPQEPPAPPMPIPAKDISGVATRTEDPDTSMTEIFGYTMQQQEQQQPRRTRTGLGDITNLLPLQQALQPRQAKRARA